MSEGGRLVTDGMTSIINYLVMWWRTGPPIEAQDRMIDACRQHYGSAGIRAWEQAMALAQGREMGETT